MSPPPEAIEDSVWVQRVKAGDPDAFEPLVLRHAGKIRRLVWGLLGEQREEAEDVVQEIFLKAYLALPKFREDARFTTWLYRIAVNHCRDMGRRAPPPHVEFDEARVEGLADERAGDSEPEPEDPLLPARREELHRLLDGLSERQRRILVMREIEGMSYEEIGGVLNIPPGTVRSRLNRARAGLLKAVEKRREETP